MIYTGNIGDYGITQSECYVMIGSNGRSRELGG